ncbi:MULTISPECIES: zinc ribbon domain-containing protein [unclassified Microcoleus]|uniref:zinc ribbon domain-containing protein n=1 Tax=unclassified Microcoleus TaxID=2642155 RepID=UPI002FD77970
MANARDNFQEKLSPKLVQENQVIVVENMAVRKLVKIHCLAKVISECGWSNLTGQLKYKAERDGKTYLDIGRFFARSSKSCHVGLNQVGSLPLEVPRWTCSNSKTKHDRDVNSAIIIGDEGLGLLALGTSTTAQGWNVSLMVARKSSVRSAVPVEIGSLHHRE